MYLDIVLIDYIHPTGVLTTYRIIPKDSINKVVIDRLRDIDMGYDATDALNIGGARVYNASDCTIQAQETKLRRFSLYESNRTMFFTFEHMGIPVGSQRQGHGGYYYLVLPPMFKFSDLHIVDPYDNSHNAIEQKKHFRYDILWDTSCNTSLSSMFLTSGRGTFSFILRGQAKLNEKNSNINYLKARETEYAVAEILNHPAIAQKSRRMVAEDIAKRSEWLMLQPNFFGLGINLNAIIKDSVKAFQDRIKR